MRWVGLAIVLVGCGDDSSVVDAGASDAPVDVRTSDTAIDTAVDALADGSSDATDASADTATDASVDAPPPEGFAVLTMNLWNAFINGDWDERRAQVAAMIMRERPDAVCLQEVVESFSLDNGAEELATETGYQYEYLQTHEASLFQEGIAILSRWPIASVENVQLPITDFGFANRHVLKAVLRVDGNAVVVSCSHMSISTDADEKAEEAARAFELIDRDRTDDHAYFAGDLNAEPDSRAMRLLRGEDTFDAITGDLIDAWTTAHPGDPGLTHPTDGPDKRIDYVYLVPGTGALPTITCTHVLTEPVDGTYASDHRGVLCRFAE